MDIQSRGNLFEAHPALVLLGASSGGCGNDLVDHRVRKIPVAETQDQDAVSCADHALYGADLAYSTLRGLCGLIWLQSELSGSPVCSLCALSVSCLLSSAIWGSNLECWSAGVPGGHFPFWPVPEAPLSGR